MCQTRCALKIQKQDFSPSATLVIAGDPEIPQADVSVNSNHHKKTKLNIQKREGMEGTGRKGETFVGQAKGDVAGTQVSPGREWLIGSQSCKDGRDKDSARKHHCGVGMTLEASGGRRKGHRTGPWQ